MTNYSPAMLTAQFLNDSGIGQIQGIDGVSIWISREASQPDESITIYDTGGQNPESYELDVFHRTIQIRVRSNDYLDGYKRCIDIKNLLIYSNTIQEFISVYPIGDVNHLNEDEEDRFIFTTNYQILM